MTFLLAGVMGWPIHHSLSPRLHGFWLQKHTLAGAYIPLAVAPERLGAAVRGLPALGFRGANVTIPHKETVLPFLDALSPTAARIGAVNTILCRDDGTLLGDSTDGYGFLTALTQEAPASQKDCAVVLGAGGAARAVVDALHQAGVREIRILNRSQDRAEALVAHLGCGRVFAWGDETALEGASLVVNTTSLGMLGHPPLELSLEALPAHAVVFDLIYNPFETPLLRAARSRGLNAVNGLGMLLHQAVPGFTAWFGVEPQVTPELRAFVQSGLS